MCWICHAGVAYRVPNSTAPTWWPNDDRIGPFDSKLSQFFSRAIMAKVVKLKNIKVIALIVLLKEFLRVRVKCESNCSN